MESRQEPRFETDQEITVTILGDVEIVFPAKIINFSGKGVCVQSTPPLPLGSPLKIEFTDTLLLGEVAYCRPEREGYHSGISIDQALYRTRDLAALAKRLMYSDPRNVEVRP